MLSKDEIEYLLNNPHKIKEDSNLECKEAKKDVPKDFWPTYSAFANTNGGHILLGVKENTVNHSFSITGIDEPEKTKKTIIDTAANTQKVSVNVLKNGDLVIHNVNNKTVISVCINKANNNDIPVHLHNDIQMSFVRLGEADQKLTKDKLSNFISSYSSINKDNNIIENTSIDDINLGTLTKYRQLFQTKAPDHRYNTLSDEEFLKQINALSKNLETNITGLTYAGLLMFGKLHIIRQKKPSFFLDYQELNPEDNTRYNRRITVDDLAEEGNIFEFYLAIAPIINDLGKNRTFKLKNLTRTDENSITISLREAIINTLTHADYQNEQDSIKIIKNNDEITFENPGVMLVNKDAAIHGGSTICRNSTLHNMFRSIGLCERQGQGISYIFKNWEKELLVIPELQQDCAKTILKLKLQDREIILSYQRLVKLFPNKFEKLGSLEKNILILAEQNDGWINHEIIINNLSASNNREVTLKLVSLDKKGFLVGRGKQRDKYYHLKGIKISEINELYVTKTVQNESYRHPNADASILPPLSILSIKISTYDEYHRIINPNLKYSNVIIQKLDRLDKEYITTLKSIINPDFYIKKQKNKEELQYYILSICNEQYVSLSAISDLLQMNSDTLRKNIIKDLINQNKLIYAYPQQPNHKEQAYITNPDQSQE